MTNRPLKINQSTFDDVVKENIVEFSMPVEEALEDAMQQLKTQGVDMSGIVTCPWVKQDDGNVTIIHPILDILVRLKEVLKEDPIDNSKLSSELMNVRNECNKGWPYRNLATSNGAFTIMLNCCSLPGITDSVVTEIFETFGTVANGQPDLFTPEALDVVISTLRLKKDNPDDASKLLRILQMATTRHEFNRQLVVEKGSVGLIIETMTINQTDATVVQRGCFALRTLTMDDDIRAEFGKAHEHAKLIVVEHGGLKLLADLLKEHRNNVYAASEILLTIGKLVVRHEFCKEVVEIGVLEQLLKTLAMNVDNQSLVRNIMVLMKALAGNDDVKNEIVKAGGATLIVEAMDKHVQHSSIGEAGCAALGALALRCPSHCSLILSAGGGSAIVRAMEQHPSEINIQKQGCMAVRNLVARTRNLCPIFLELGVEPIIRKARETFPQVEDEAKAALRDLGCQVELKELWTGKHGNLQN